MSQVVSRSVKVLPPPPALWELRSPGPADKGGRLLLAQISRGGRAQRGVNDRPGSDPGFTCVTAAHSPLQMTVLVSALFYPRPTALARQSSQLPAFNDGYPDRIADRN
ncbi:hypothetical protein AAFF_G00270830 [Aldrovandia affinis]|uniref:Uncharacterized protein n=1 Tax=Aldrovandia affinis TaxID=143900 RepID=A0AAD7RAX2_9TELE|nr:hypothetical protein AAFF_G00270830 [Aldrovandia affinis]